MATLTLNKTPPKAIKTTSAIPSKVTPPKAATPKAFGGPTVHPVAVKIGEQFYTLTQHGEVVAVQVVGHDLNMGDPQNITTRKDRAVVFVITPESKAFGQGGCYGLDELFTPDARGLAACQGLAEKEAREREIEKAERDAAKAARDAAKAEAEAKATLPSGKPPKVPVATQKVKTVLNRPTHQTLTVPPVRRAVSVAK